MTALPRPRKRFGQHFLKDAHIIDALISAISPKPDDYFIEIGPGRGALTFPMLKKIEHLTAIEIDRDLVAHLQDCDQLTVIEADALSFDYGTLIATEKNPPCPPLYKGGEVVAKKIRLIGNLPYNISTPLMLHLLTFMPHIQDCHFMVQKEVADRIAASPSTKDYGRLSVMMQYFCETHTLFHVPPESFYPPPKVDSAIIQLIPHAVSPYPTIPFAQLEKTVKQAFAHRRKTLKNNFKNTPIETQWDILSAHGIEPRQRPEELTVAQFVNIAQYMV